MNQVIEIAGYGTLRVLDVFESPDYPGFTGFWLQNVQTNVIYLMAKDRLRGRYGFVAEEDLRSEQERIEVTILRPDIATLRDDLVTLSRGGVRDGGI